MTGMKCPMYPEGIRYALEEICRTPMFSDPDPDVRSLWLLAEDEAGNTNRDRRHDAGGR